MLRSTIQEPIGGLYSENDSLERPILATDWFLPARVKIEDGYLKWGFTTEEGKADIRFVVARKGMLEGFLNLHKGTDKQISTFALRWGVLGLCHHSLPYYHRVDCRPVGWSFESREKLEDWRYFSRTMYALLRIGNCIRQDKGGRLEDWEQALERNYSVPLSPEQLKDNLRGSKLFLPWCLQELIELSNIRVRIVWPLDKRRSALRYGTDGLLAGLVMQLILAISNQNRVDCSHCGAEYTPLRAPKSGFANFCPDCRDKRIPTTESSRRWKLKHSTATSQEAELPLATSLARRDEERGQIRAKKAKRVSC